MNILFLGPVSITKFLPHYYKDKSPIPHPGLLTLKYANQFTKLFNDEVSIVTISSDYDKDYKFVEDNVKYYFLKSTHKIIKYLSLLKSNEFKIRNLIKKINPDIIYGLGLGNISADENTKGETLCKYFTLLFTAFSYINANKRWIVKSFFSNLNCSLGNPLLLTTVGYPEFNPKSEYFPKPKP